MRRRRGCRARDVLFLVLLAVGAYWTPAAQARPLEFHLTFAPAVSREPFTGRIYVLLSRQQSRELPAGPTG